MQAAQLRTLLEAPDSLAEWLRPLGFRDVRAGHASLLRLAETGLPLDLLGMICEQFANVAPQLADADMAWFNLERFLLAARSPLSTAALFERDDKALPQLLTLLTASQDLSDLLCTDPESYDFLRMTEGLPVARTLLVDELLANVRVLKSEGEVLAALRTFKRRETLRIAYGDIVGGQSVEQITRQISYVADAVVEAALDFATRKVQAKRQSRRRNNAPPPRIAVLALGKLGGLELNYSSDIDLVILHTGAGDDARDSAGEFANRVVQELIRLLTETTELGAPYRVDMRLRPEGRQAPLSISVEQAFKYYDTRGRTWERQAYVKARVIAGDLAMGQELLDRLEPWIYSRYLSLADITGIKVLKRRIERGAETAGVAGRNVKTGRGGIRDIEFVIQFLQLLSGGGLPSVRTGNTLQAIERLEQAGCLTPQERTLLEENYRFLRNVEHRLQVMFDLRTHEIPAEPTEQQKLARRLGYVDEGETTARERLLADYQERTNLNRKVLDHLLHDAFGDDPETQPEVDLVNSPDPSPETIEAVLGRYPFRDPHAAYQRLTSLASEVIPFLSRRRCRLFLASIAPRLLTAVAETPDPDATLVALCRISDSLGGKAALWELFSSSQASLNMYVTLCAACPYLAGILTSNPGMIDELLDSLLVEHLPTQSRLEETLAELTRGAEDIDPILHSFKNAQHLRVGIRDILGKDSIVATHRALSDVAEACLKLVVQNETERLKRKYGEPTIEFDAEAQADQPPRPWQVAPANKGQPCELIVLAQGKLGGREPNYHSDLDLVFLYESEGKTTGGTGPATSNSHFFGELAQRIMKAANHFGPYGRLFEIDPRLRPTGRGGQLAIGLDSFVRYFTTGGGELWERLALCKSRVIIGSPEAAQHASAAVHEAVFGTPWRDTDAAEIRQMRYKLQESASDRNIKRSVGGTMDAEFVTQMLQLKHGRDIPEICKPGTLEAIRELAKADRLSPDEAQELSDHYE
ncbi:bifunctional [glutamate--ammonia ligase]-adenylyl-L-tyrosine phosphorylase/[glutamate--ammonia-ligase] adenylyltransferase, partial [Pirellulales bacterium]|nr:bifunctional [glutamate--ammonia ligase]-adenylyl-L-tyrosine phosphorylase/[glutamate--ammonia-ligase] adenylyltransferase [Pirellulales bacterium]